MADLQSIEELLDSAERKQKSENQQPTPNKSEDAPLDHKADYVSLGTPKESAPRDGKRSGDRYTPGGSRRDDPRDRMSEDGNRSDRGSANGSVRSRRRSRSPRDRRDKSYRSRDERSGNGGDYYRGGQDDEDRYYRPGDRGDRRDDRRDRRDRRDERPERRDDRRREPRERRRTPPEPTDDERDRRTVFVQQLAARLRTYQLVDFFAQVGPVKEAQIVKDRVSNRSKGVGYVEFKSEESVEKALQLTGQKLLGIPIIAQLTEAEKNRQARNTEGVATLSNGIPFHRLYVGNIHFSITEDDLRTIFEPFGNLEFCQLQKEEQGRSKGYGFVQFTEPSEAKDALEKMNGFELAGRPIRVGLGNDKFTPETTQSLLQKFGSQGQGQNQQQQQKQSFQGSSFSGMGGRGAHAGGTANFDRAGGKDAEKTGGASALDDTDVAGVNFSNYSRDALMRKLARVEDSEPKAAPKAQQKKAPIDEAAPSRCVLLKNLYTEKDTQTPGWDKELEEDVKEECTNSYGKVVHIGVAPGSTDGEIYIKFDQIQGGENAIKGLNGRFFGGQRITAQYLVDAVYNMNFPQAANV